MGSPDRDYLAKGDRLGDESFWKNSFSLYHVPAFCQGPGNCGFRNAEEKNLTAEVAEHAEL